MKTRSRRHDGFTLFEVVVVIAVLVLLAAIIIPSVVSFRGDTQHRAAADVIRAEIATARARAKDEGKPYRVAISEDKKRIRRAPDDDQFALATAVDQALASAPVVEYAFEGVTVEPVAEASADPPAAIDGWYTIVVLRNDGTCDDDSGALLAIKEGDHGALYLRVRGLTGAARVVPAPGAQPATPNGGTP